MSKSLAEIFALLDALLVNCNFCLYFPEICIDFSSTYSLSLFCVVCDEFVACCGDETVEVMRQNSN